MFESKFVPLTVKVNWPLPTTIEVGEILVTAGARVPGASVVNIAAFDVPPPGPGLNTVTASVPADTTSVAGMLAVNWVLEINVVALAELSNLTEELEIKLVPFTVSVKAASPSVLDEGDMLVIAGTGLSVLIVRRAVLENPPAGAGLNTVIFAVPATLRSATGRIAVTWVDELNVVALGAPFRYTMEPAIKPLPLTVNVMVELPCATVDGDIPVMAGTGFCA